MHFFCSLFDSKYAAQGLALYQSLLEHTGNGGFVLYVLPMDDKCEEALYRLALPQMELVDRGSFEVAMQLGDVKQNRTYQEYCWTCASNLAEYLMLRRDPELPEITYIDADCLFMDDPEIVFEEIDGRSIAIIPHRFSRENKRLRVNGDFNVSLVHFRNTPAGRECLSTWARQCRERCSAAVGCGDQLYLNEWPGLYRDDLAVIANIGVGVAPWNLQQYRVTVADGRVFVDDVPVVLYHYHEFAQRNDGSVCLTNYPLRPEDKELIYAPYVAKVSNLQQRIFGAKGQDATS